VKRSEFDYITDFLHDMYALFHITKIMEKNDFDIINISAQKAHNTLFVHIL